MAATRRGWIAGLVGGGLAMLGVGKSKAQGCGTEVVQEAGEGVEHMRGSQWEVREFTGEVSKDWDDPRNWRSGKITLEWAAPLSERR